MTDTDIIGIEVARGRVLPEWIDFNEHMNVAYYVLAFDSGVDSLWIEFGITEEHIREMRSSTFAVEAHITYKRELNLDDPFIVSAQILAFDEKRIHQFQRLYHATDRYLAATAEWMTLHVDLKTRRVAPWPPQILADISKVANAQGDWPYPQEAGRQMGVQKPIFSIGNGAQ
jgi:acyl-CoA thioester hydrolase